jgi:hypothetical protein
MVFRSLSIQLAAVLQGGQDYAGMCRMAEHFLHRQLLVQAS